jgi:DNA polymerase-3 subunit epsilon
MVLGKGKGVRTLFHNYGHLFRRFTVFSLIARRSMVTSRELHAPRGSLAMKFVAIDFETANPCLSSVCQIGVVSFADGRQTHSWKTFINPDDYFADMNVSVHGISKDHVKDAPKFPHVFEQLAELMRGQIVVHHTGFDRIAFGQASDKHKLPSVECNWLDTVRVARNTWPDLEGGHGLVNLAKHLGVEFRHHDAEEDARVSGEILLRAIALSGETVTDLLGWASSQAYHSSSGQSTGRPWRKFDSADYRRDGNPLGALAGETIVFTGALSMSRRDAADLAAEAGCDVANSVTKATTLLVVGDQDIRFLADGQQKSSKHRKAEEMIAKGYNIRILGESDFQRIIGKKHMKQGADNATVSDALRQDV